MKQKESFKRFDIEELKRKKLLDNIIDSIGEKVLTQAEELAQELVDQGYDPDEFEFDTRHSLSDDGIYRVEYYLVRLVKVSEYDVKELI